MFDASDTTNARERQTIPLAVPEPRKAFETRERFVKVSEDVMRVGRRLEIGDADINLNALLQAESKL